MASGGRETEKNNNGGTCVKIPSDDALPNVETTRNKEEDKEEDLKEEKTTKFSCRENQRGLAPEEVV